MNLIKELVQEMTEAEAARKEFLLQEQKQALYFLEVKHEADLLTKAGITTSIRNLAEFANLFDAEVEAAIKWFNRKGPGKMPFELDYTGEPQSELDQLIAGLSWIANRRLTRTKGRVTPPLDRSVLGMQKVMQLTGLGRVRILELVEQNEEAIKKVFSDFTPAWVKDDQSVIQKNAKNQHPETKIKLIRQAVEEISQGRTGMVTGAMLAKWKNGAIGLDQRQIDKYLQTHPDLRDLDKHRALGTFVGVTDADREARYMRNR